MRNLFPWYAKIIAKIILCRLPINARVWKRLRLFELGQMQDVRYAIEVFNHHYHILEEYRDMTISSRMLEIGPGYSVLSGVIANVLCGCSSILVDVGNFAERDIEVYKQSISDLINMGVFVPDIDDMSDFNGLLRRFDIMYLTDGLSSIKDIPSESIDFCWSQAALEHIRAAELPEIMNELRRVLAPTGVASHRVDLRDHLASALNNLRVPSRLWEADWFARSGFYTNRVRFSRMLELFKDAGFRVTVVGVERWEKLPTPRSQLQHEYRALPDYELLVRGFDVVLQPMF